MKKLLGFLYEYFKKLMINLNIFYYYSKDKNSIQIRGYKIKICLK